MTLHKDQLTGKEYDKFSKKFLVYLFLSIAVLILIYLGIKGGFT